MQGVLYFVAFMTRPAYARDVIPSQILQLEAWAPVAGIADCCYQGYSVPNGLASTNSLLGSWLVFLVLDQDATIVLRMVWGGLRRSHSIQVMLFSNVGSYA
jgi:hypothetical protein